MKLHQFLITALSTLAVATVAEFTLSTSVGAITFSGTSGGVWGQPDPGSINNISTYTGVGTDFFTWGLPFPDEPKFGTPANSFKFAGIDFKTSLNSLFKIGDLSYFNGTVPLGTNVEKVPLNLNVGFKTPSKTNETFDFDFNLVNTKNTSDNPIDNADFAYITPKVNNRGFSYNGKKYTLELTGFSQDGGLTNLKEFRVLEGTTATAAIYGKISSILPAQPVERVPESGAVIGLSCFGVYMLVRKNKMNRE
jgi:hypothetical protein